MRPRRAVGAAVLLVLLLGAVLGTYRSVRVADDDPARRLSSELRCPACQGESVADSRSPIAAAIREVIAARLRAGDSPEEVRTYLVRRYGAEVLATPPAQGWGLLLWLVPVLALGVGAGSALRTHRRRRGAAPGARPAPPRPTRRPPPPVTAAGVWTAGAVAVLALVGGVAVAAPRLATAPEPARRPGPAIAADPVLDLLALARAAEEQGRYEAAAEIYRTALERRPADEIRLRFAFILIRLGQTAEAARLAETVLAARPDTPDALLMLGLAQRDSDPAASVHTLRRFLDRAPGHPAAAEVRRLLGDG
ncbi:cytochrome c-type biogenesis protein [Micromonospora sp. HM5-17]|uniref:cytochrome c-type biogenesis protein n=1 Tax=Micromonospora sp. HM5-17 TaxID=2487710 RepID=UPI0013156BA7|nr:cytochrome c-type biogenesis protein [Micromonospora sp. HM5-17]